MNDDLLVRWSALTYPPTTILSGPTPIPVLERPAAIDAGDPETSTGDRQDQETSERNHADEFGTPPAGPLPLSTDARRRNGWHGWYDRRTPERRAR